MLVPVLCWRVAAVPFEPPPCVPVLSVRPLKDGPRGDAHQPVDILNHLAAWLEPRRLSFDAAELVEAIFAFALGDLDSGERERLTLPARRWTLDATRTREGNEQR